MSPIHEKKNLSENQDQRELPQYHKEYLQKFIANITFNAEKLEYFPQGSGTR